MLSPTSSWLRISWVVVGLYVAGGSALNARAQQPEPDLLSDLRASFSSLEYARVERLARAALDQYDRYTPDELAEVHRVLGLTYFYRGSTERAREEFAAALSLNSTVELDPLMVPPQAVAFYEEMRREAAMARPDHPSLRYLFVVDRRPAAAVRSFLVPGWGQIYKEDNTKGIALLGAWGVTAGGGLAVHMARGVARRAYERAEEPSEIVERYDRFNRLHKVRNSLLVGAAVVWIYGAVDALLTDAPTLGPQSASDIQFGNDLSASLTIRF